FKVSLRKFFAFLGYYVRLIQFPFERGHDAVDWEKANVKVLLKRFVLVLETFWQGEKRKISHLLRGHLDRIDVKGWFYSRIVAALPGLSRSGLYFDRFLVICLIFFGFGVAAGEK